MASHMVCVTEGGEALRISFETDGTADGIARQAVADGYIEVKAPYTLEAKGGRRTFQSGTIVYNWRFVLWVS